MCTPWLVLWIRWCNPRAAVRRDTGWDAPHTGEELKVHGDQIALEALVGTYYEKKDGKGEKAVENLTFFGEL